MISKASLAIKLYLKVKKVLQAFNLGFVPLKFPRDFEEDGLATSRIRSFEADPLFLRAIQQAETSIGSRYPIRWRTHVFLWAMEVVKSRPGVYVELGTGNAWMFTVAALRKSIPKSGEVFFFDRFQIETVDALTGEIRSNTIHPSYTDDLSALKSRFSGFDGTFHFVQGTLPGALEDFDFGKRGLIKLLHVDLNAAQPEVESLTKLWPVLAPGALVLLDDFSSPEYLQSHEAMLSLSKKLGVEILCLPTGQGLILKPIGLG